MSFNALLTEGLDGLILESERDYIVLETSIGYRGVAGSSASSSPKRKFVDINGRLIEVSSEAEVLKLKSVKRPKIPRKKYKLVSKPYVSKENDLVEQAKRMHLSQLRKLLDK